MIPLDLSLGPWSGNQSEGNYKAIYRDIIGLLFYLKRTRCWTEDEESVVCTNNQAVKCLYQKPNLEKREDWWFKFLSQLKTKRLNAEWECDHIFRNVKSRAPHYFMADESEV